MFSTNRICERRGRIFFLSLNTRYMQRVCAVTFLALSISINKHASANSLPRASSASLFFFQTGVRDALASRMLRVPADHEEFASSRARPYGQHVLPGDPVNNYLQRHERGHVRYQGKPYADGVAV